MHVGGLWDDSYQGRLCSLQLRSTEILGREEELVQGSKRTRGRGAAPQFLTVAAVSVVFRDDRRQVDISEVRRDYDEYRDVNVIREPASGTNLDALFDQDWLWAHAGDAFEFSEERLNPARALLKEVSWAEQVSKNDYVDIVQQLAREVKEARWKSEIDQDELAERNGKIEEVNLQVQRMADDSEKVARIHA